MSGEAKISQLFGFALLVLAAAMGGLGQTKTETDSSARIAQYCDPKPQSDGADAPNIYCIDEGFAGADITVSRWSGTRGRSYAAWHDVTVDLPATANENDPMPGRVSLVRFDLMVWDDNLFSDFPVRATERNVGSIVGDDRDIPPMIHLETIGPICVGFATTRHHRIVGLHQLLEPLVHIGRLVFPLSKVSG
jgi:hypothetical protein